MRWIALVVGIVLLLAAGVLVAGSLLPVSHVATVERRVEGTPEEVWRVITDPEAFPSWRPGVDSVQMVRSQAGSEAWTEYSGFGPLPMEVVRRESPHLLVTRVADEELPFGGTWTFSLEPQGRATRVTITEEGHVDGPFFRFVSRYVMGYEGTMETYLDGLERRMADGPR